MTGTPSGKIVPGGISRAVHGGVAPQDVFAGGPQLRRTIARVWMLRPWAISRSCDFSASGFWARAMFRQSSR
jgi:hypothetical protein